MQNSLFSDTGAHVLVDGQFGSTGKGALAAWLAKQAFGQNVHFDTVVSNAGPNSGHTFYHGDDKHVLKQLPTFAVATSLRKVKTPKVVLSAGSIINPQILNAEVEKYGIAVTLHPNAAVITDEDVRSEHRGSVAEVAGTRSGTGAALARKVLRDPSAIVRNAKTDWHPLITISDDWVDARNHRVFVEVSQGFSLGINSHFYPKVTSRECTAAQALADARIPSTRIARTYMCCRTFPIRVGNVDGHNSGDCYPDQIEIDWGKLNVEPELTTVTQRVRRVFTWSWLQFKEAVLANEPDFVFINFLNYLPEDERSVFVMDVRVTLSGFSELLGINKPDLIVGMGPKTWETWRV